ncbi:energy transducer TonB [Pedobacter sp. PWIIR3]
MNFKLTVLFSIFFITAAFAKSPLAFQVSDKLIKSDTAKKDTIPADFPGGINLFYEYLKTHVKYPVASRLNGLQGKVHLKFVIDTVGNVTNVKILKKLDRYTNLQAVRVVTQSPKWIPATIKGKKAKFIYNIPISFSDTSSSKGAAVMVSGKLLKNNRRVAKLPLDTMPYLILPENLTQAVFGPKYKRKLLVFNKTNLDINGYDEAQFKDAFKLLQNIDTSKVQLNVYHKDLPLDQWSKYLNKDSILSIFIYPASVSRPFDQKKLGTVVLMTKAGLENDKKTKRDLIDNILAYRKDFRNPPKEMIAIDDYYYNPQLVYNGLDTAIIKTVNLVDSARIVRMYGTNFKSGCYYIYTKNYNQNKYALDRQKLFTMIDQYKKTQIASVDDQLYLNNFPIDFKSLSAVPAKDIAYVRMITNEETKAYMGYVPMRNSIFIHTTQEYIDKSPIEVRIAPPPDIKK